MAKKPLPSPELLRQLLDYDPATGIFIWKRRDQSNCPGDKPGWLERWNRQYAGKPAFTATNYDGYFHAFVLCHCLLAHRVAWAIVHGKWPDGTIDHINGNHQDNRIENLRDVPRSVNMKNMRKSKANTSGATGVARSKSGKWEATICVNRKVMRLGTFLTFDEAVTARKRAEADHGFHENHGAEKVAEKKYVPRKQRV